MIRAKKFIIDLYNKMFIESEVESENRRLTINNSTGELNWSEGKLPFGEGPDEEEIKKAGCEGYILKDDKEKGTRMFNPIPNFHEVFRKNRFQIEFPGIPEYLFQSYNYIGTDVHSKKKLFSNEIIKDDYSSFKVLMLFPCENVDICDKLKELEENPKIGDIKINLLDATGVIVKTIIIPKCEVTEIKVFRELDYGNCGDKKDTILVGEIIVKHKQRKLI